MKKNTLSVIRSPSCPNQTCPKLMEVYQFILSLRKKGLKPSDLATASNMKKSKPVQSELT